MYKFLGTDWTTGAFDRENWNKNVQEAKYRATKGNASLSQDIRATCADLILTFFAAPMESEVNVQRVSTLQGFS